MLVTKLVAAGVESADPSVAADAIAPAPAPPLNLRIHSPRPHSKRHGSALERADAVPLTTSQLQFAAAAIATPAATRIETVARIRRLSSRRRTTLGSLHCCKVFAGLVVSVVVIPFSVHLQKKPFSHPNPRCNAPGSSRFASATRAWSAEVLASVPDCSPMTRRRNCTISAESHSA